MGLKDWVKDPPREQYKEKKIKYGKKLGAMEDRCRNSSSVCSSSLKRG